MPYLTVDDFVEAYAKLRQRGLPFLASKLSWDARERTRSAFDDVTLEAANWWAVPEVRRRWNRLITGKPDLEYEPYFMEKYLSGQTGLRLLSLGSGICSHEIKLAQSKHFAEATCVDIAGNLLRDAARKAAQLGLDNMVFREADLYRTDFESESYDVVFFHASLHHFAEVEQMLIHKVRPVLRPGGLIVINEYVGPNRLQYPKYQIAAINEALQLLPKRYRLRFKTRAVKQKVQGPGLWRMILADPSECVDSESILPALHRHFRTLEEKPYGGNLLMLTLKDIAHHFVQPDGQALKVLHDLFAAEDRYLQQHPSDFTFGVYQHPG